MRVRVFLFFGWWMVVTSALAGESDLQTEIDELRSRNEALEQAFGRLEDLVAGTGEGQEGDVHLDVGQGATTFGAYGEIHARIGGADKEVDLHRLVGLIGHDFDASTRFWSEIEIEHGQVGTGQGEISVEQAYIEGDLAHARQIRAGLILVPAGIVNESHEPTAFHGVERNPVERTIIPTTWREAGVKLQGRLDEQVDYVLALHSGLEMGADYSLRAGRQAAVRARLEDLAYTARLRWRPVNGLQLAGTIQYQEDVGQGRLSGTGEALFATTHAIWRAGRFEARALYASWWLAGSAARRFGADRQSGWYLEPAYRLGSRTTVFARQSLWDTRPHDAVDSQSTETMLGVDIRWHENVVIKADVGWNRQGSARGRQVDLGLGFAF